MAEAPVGEGERGALIRRVGELRGQEAGANGARRAMIAQARVEAERRAREVS